MEAIMRQSFLLFFILLLSLVIVSQAQEDYEPEPDTPADNECYSGGTMQSNCDTEWEWQCGWYMARFNNGVYTREEVPVWCSILLPRDLAADEAGAGGFPFPTCTATSTSGVTSTY